MILSLLGITTSVTDMYAKHVLFFARSTYYDYTEKAQMAGDITAHLYPSTNIPTNRERQQCTHPPSKRLKIAQPVEVNVK